jgi:integrase
MDSTDGVLHEMVTLVLSTGLRAGEIAGLEWPDVSFADRRISVERQFGRNGQRDPKYDQHREVFFWSRVAALLGRRREAEGPVFVDSDTRERFKPQKMTALLNIAWEAIAPRPRGHSWHTLRHTYASLVADAGVPDRLIEETLGHTRADVTSRYIHRFDPALDKLATPLDEALGVRLDALRRRADLTRASADPTATIHSPTEG